MSVGSPSVMDFSISTAAASSGNGAITRAKLRRTAVVYVGLLALGVLLCLVPSSAFLNALGVGLWFPGAGFLAAGGWPAILTAVTLVLFALALIAWFGSGATTFPVLVWGLSAVAAGTLAGESISTAGTLVAVGLLLAFVAFQTVSGRRTRAAALARRRQRVEAMPQTLEAWRARAEPTPAARSLEIDEHALKSLRYVFDRALQPVGQFDGYTIIDQFQTASLRYQINQFAYCLSVMQAHYTPNFHGYGTEAQRNLIETYRSKRVWGYWRLENAWGNLSLNGDPVRKDNIMLTGYYGLQVALYTKLTGDDRYLKPGSLRFARSENRAWDHDLHSVVGSLVYNYRRYEDQFCLFPCEPNWVYTACNFRGLTALQVYDQVAGTSHFEEFADHFRSRLEAEFTGPDLSVVALRSQLTGLAVPFPLPDGTLVIFLASLFPDLAERAWAFVRSEGFTTERGRLRAVLPKPAIDVTHYKPGYGQGLETLYGAAREMGDQEAAEAALEAMDEHCSPVEKDGVAYYETVGNALNGCMATDRLLRRDLWRNTVIDPARIGGPILAQAQYPDVGVAKAVSDGRDLELVLHGRGPQTLRLDRLDPGATYAVGDGSLAAGNDGQAELRVDLSGRTVVHVRPAD